MPFDGLRHVAGEEVIHQHHARTDAECGRELAEAVVEAERQHGEQPVVGGVLEVGRDALGTGEHVPVRQHHALRLPGAARGVEDRHHVDVDHSVRRVPAVVRRQLVPGDRALPHAGRLALAHEHQRLEIRAVLQRGRQVAGPVGQRHECPHVAVAQDVRDLLGLEERVDGHEHESRARDAEERRDRLEALRQVHADARLLLEPERQQSGGDPGDEPVELGVAERGRVLQQRRPVSGTVGRERDERIESGRHGVS
jgi:hypothetical protein